MRIRKFTEQLYKVIVRDIKRKEIIIERRDMDALTSMDVFNGLKDHFQIETPATIKTSKAYAKNDTHGIVLLKQRRKRLL
jgi:hypothetical protein